LLLSVRLRRSARLGLQDPQRLAHSNVILEFFVFRGRQSSGSVPGGEAVHPGAVIGGEIEAKQSTGGLRRQDRVATLDDPAQYCHLAWRGFCGWHGSNRPDVSVQKLDSLGVDHFR
jgi:hypothetical protein